MDAKDEIEQLLLDRLEFGSSWHTKKGNQTHRIVTIGQVKNGQVECCEYFQGKAYGWWESVVDFQAQFEPVLEEHGKRNG